MSNLASLAALAQGGAALSDAGQAYSSYQGQLGQSRYQSSVLNQNSQIAQMQAAQAQKAADWESTRRGLQAAQEIGKARVYSGDLNVNSGSAAQMQGDIRSAAIQDEAQIMNNAALQRWGYGIEAANYATQAKMAKYAGRFGANSSLISGGMRFARDAGLGAYYYKQGQQDTPNPTYGPIGAPYKSSPY